MPDKVVFTLMDAFITEFLLSFDDLWEVIHLIAWSSFFWVAEVADDRPISLCGVVVAYVSFTVDDGKSTHAIVSVESWCWLYFYYLGSQILKDSLVLDVAQEYVHVVLGKASKCV